MIRLGDEVILLEGGPQPLGRVIAFHTTVQKATIALPHGGTIMVPLHLLRPTERPIAHKSAPRRRN